MSEKIVEDIYGKLKPSWWGKLLIAVTAIGVVMFVVWNSLPDDTKERVLTALHRGNGCPGVIPSSTPECDLRVAAVTFEPNSPYLEGMAGIRLGMLVPEAIQILERCGTTYRIEQDSPVMRRFEVTPIEGIISGITYYSLTNKINTVGFSISSGTSHEELRIAARRAFGPPDRQWTNKDFHYDQWSIGDSRLSVFEQGGSLFTE